MDYEVIRINENSWRIEDSGVRFFLLTGTERALLIDSGMRVSRLADGLVRFAMGIVPDRHIHRSGRGFAFSVVSWIHGLIWKDDPRQGGL